MVAYLEGSINMRIPFAALDKQHAALLPEILPVIENIFRIGQFILGKPVIDFEKKFADYHQIAFAIGVNSGTDALILSLRALGIGVGDEVITTANTFITTVSSIALVGASPILVDVGADDNIDVMQIEKHITPRTKAILPIHWTGRPCDMEIICQLAKKYNLHLIEDCAQAVSAKYNGRLVGTFGKVGCFSLHPFKTLNACGDGGIVITHDAALAEKIRILRQNGLTSEGISEVWSNNSRLDTMQAAILNIKFKYFEKWTQRRIAVAAYYSQQLKDVAEISLPAAPSEKYHAVFHTYIIKVEKRDQLKDYLQSQGIETRIHYQVPVYRQPIAIKTLNCKPANFPAMERVSQQALSLPIYPELDVKQQDYIIEKIKTFYILFPVKKEKNITATECIL